MSKETQTPAKIEATAPEQRNDPPFTLREGAASYHGLAATQCVRSAAWSYIKDDQSREMMAEASMGLYLGLQPQTALESALSMLFVGVTNASLDCLSLAGRVPPEHIEHRELNLRYGYKGAQVAAELAQALEASRGKNPGAVTVGNVTVESGGQAIVGNVQTGHKEKEPADPDSGAPQATK